MTVNICLFLHHLPSTSPVLLLQACAINHTWLTTALENGAQGLVHTRQALSIQPSPSQRFPSSSKVFCLAHLHLCLHQLILIRTLALRLQFQAELRHLS